MDRTVPIILTRAKGRRRVFSCGRVWRPVRPRLHSRTPAFPGARVGYRFYEPNLQRWLNRDPIGEAGGINLYAFVNNVPVGGVDCLGLEPDLPPGFHFYPPGSRDRNAGDWIPGGDLDDCILLAMLRHMHRLKEAQFEELIGAACVPGIGWVLESLHITTASLHAGKAAESRRVMHLDLAACYLIWDPSAWPNYLLPL